MNTVGRILVPVDFSNDSAAALKYAVSLAHKTQAEVIVMHVTQKPEADAFLNLVAMMEGCPALNPPAGIPVDRLLREKALDLYHFVDREVRSPGQLKISRKVTLGNHADKILRCVKEDKVDLVVLATRKTLFFPYLMARGRLLRMISRFPCPVLLTPFADEPRSQSGLIGRSIFAR
jgi:nucleotide-binding universal stress UspA family protein